MLRTIGTAGSVNSSPKFSQWIVGREERPAGRGDLGLGRQAVAHDQVERQQEQQRGDRQRQVPVSSVFTG